MATIQELEQKIQRLEREIRENAQKQQELLAKSEKALDYALHAYRIDHNGYIWVWDTESQAYRKTNIHICTPEVEDRSITERKMADRAVTARVIDLLAVLNKHLADNAVATRNLQDKSVTERKMADHSVSSRTVQKDAILNKHLADNSVSNRNLQKHSVSFDNLLPNVPQRITVGPISALDEKYRNITNELYSMIASLQAGGIALSGRFGNRTDIGITQKYITEMFRKVWDKLGEITGEDYNSFAMTVEPTVVISEHGVEVNVSASSLNAICGFSTIKFYADDVLMAEGEDTLIFNATFTINSTSVIRCVAEIAGVVYEKSETVTVYDTPFFMGGGQVYTDVMNIDCLKEIEGSLEGSYALTVNNDGEKMFIIIPESRREEFRRANLTFDMSGFEIPLTVNDTGTIIVLESVNTYQAGTYNIDININS